MVTLTPSSVMNSRPRNAADQSGRRGLILQHGLGDAIAVAGAALVGVGWAHAVATSVKKTPAQDGGRAPQPAYRRGGLPWRGPWRPRPAECPRHQRRTDRMLRGR